MIRKLTRITEERDILKNSKQFHIVAMCKVLKVSKSGYYQWSAAADQKDAQEDTLCTKVLEISDITYVWTDEGWLFLASVIDLYSRRVVGWSMSKSLKSKMAQDALAMAVATRHPGEGLIHHSDRGVQCACKDYQKILNAHKMKCSMSRKGDLREHPVRMGLKVWQAIRRFKCHTGRARGTGSPAQGGAPPKRRARDSKKNRDILHEGERVRFEFMHEHKDEFTIQGMCRVFAVSPSGYYAWLNRKLSKREQEDERLIPLIREIFDESYCSYGTRRIRKSLIVRGIRCSRKRIKRLMELAGVQVHIKKKFRVTTDSNHNYSVAENLLSREFEVMYPNRVWISDITYIWTDEGWLYLAGVEDLYSRKVVGWSMGERITRDLTISVLDMATGRRDIQAGLIHHSDRGSQYACHDYRNTLRDYEMECSMSRKGDPWDNAPAESFFATLKKELINRRQYNTREEARRDIFRYIEMFYNKRRLHSSLGYKSPAEFEAQMLVKVA